MTGNDRLKNIIEDAYYREEQMIETNASMIKNYSTLFENNEITSSFEKVESQFLNQNEELKKSTLNQLELIKHNFLSNAIRLKEEYNNMLNIGK